jgi:hypothetical protein
MYCGKCGATNADDAAFCTVCGNDLKASNSPPPGPSATNPPEFAFGTIPGGKATFQLSTAFSNAINLMKNPAAFMRQNKETSVPLNTIILGYVAVLAAIPFIATLVGDLWYYAGAYALGVAIATYVLDVAGVFVIGFLIWKLAPSFATKTDQARATLLAAFVYTPVFLVSILTIIPFIGFITVLGLLYGLYILYLGLPIMLDTPADKVLSYFVVVIVVAIVVYGVIASIIGAITAALFLRTFLFG